MKKGWLLALVLLLGLLVACRGETTCTVTFDSAGGSPVPALTLARGVTLTDLPVPVKDGYVFAGWTSAGVLLGDADVIQGDITLIARWTEQATTHTVTFMAHGEVLAVQEVTDGASITAPVPPEDEDWYFLYWDTDYAHVTSDLVVTAVYEHAPTVSMAFVAAGGTIRALSTIKNDFFTDFLELTGTADVDNASLSLVRAFFAGTEGRYDWLLAYFAAENTAESAVFTRVAANSATSTRDARVLANEVTAWLAGQACTSQADSTIVSANYADASVRGRLNDHYVLHEDLTIGSTIGFAPSRRGYDFLGWYRGDRLVTRATQAGTVQARWIMNDSTAREAIASEKKTLTDLFTSATLYDSLSLSALPQEDGTTLVWSSDDPQVLSESGLITPDLVSAHEVTLSVVITAGSQSETVSFTFTVARGATMPADGLVTTYALPSSPRLTKTNLTDVDIVYLAFESFTAAGTMGHSAVTTLTSAKIKAGHEVGCRFVASIQSTSSDDRLTTIAHDPSLTATFVENIRSYLRTYELDGIDIDWEWPDSGDGAYYTTFMKALHDGLKSENPYWLVTSAIPGLTWYKRYDLANSWVSHDFINLMTYEMQIKSRGTFQSALYSGSNSRFYYTLDCSIDATMMLWDGIGVDLSLVLAGIPFFTRAFTDCAGMGQSATDAIALSYGYLQSYYASRTTYTYTYDALAGVPYAVDSAANMTFAFDDPTSIIEKGHYAMTRGLGGLMAWQLGQDDDALHLLTAMKTGLKTGQGT